LKIYQEQVAFAKIDGGKKDLLNSALILPSYFLSDQY